jgi:3-hydroxyisobutyrate dehydrogenase-like beta-hydroxyacid dehydrogenase
VIIGLLHPGMMGAAIGAQLVGAGHQVRWCPVGRSAHTVARADAAGLLAVESLGDLLSGADVVLSVCPPAFADDVADQVAAHDYPGIFVEANAINPARTAGIAARLTTATVVDGAIIGPSPNVTRTARLYLSGPDAAVTTVFGLFDGSAATPTRVDERIGSASALKMAYGSFTKTSAALAAVSHALADEYGVTALLRAEADSLGRPSLAERPSFAGAATRAWRWAPEMDEVAEALRAVGLPDALATGASEVFHRWDADKDDRELDTDTALRHLRRD